MAAYLLYGDPLRELTCEASLAQKPVNFHLLSSSTLLCSHRYRSFPPVMHRSLPGEDIEKLCDSDCKQFCEWPNARRVPSSRPLALNLVNVLNSVTTSPSVASICGNSRVWEISGVFRLT